MSQLSGPILVGNFYVVPYTAKSFLVMGPTIKIKEKLSNLKGKFSDYTNGQFGYGGAGWMFAMTHLQEVVNMLQSCIQVDKSREQEYTQRLAALVQAESDLVAKKRAIEENRAALADMIPDQQTMSMYGMIPQGFQFSGMQQALPQAAFPMYQQPMTLSSFGQPQQYVQPMAQPAPSSVGPIQQSPIGQMPPTPFLGVLPMAQMQPPPQIPQSIISPGKSALPRTPLFTPQPLQPPK